MSEPVIHDLGSPREPRLHLPTWVVVALVIILFSSCSAARDASDAASSARDAANVNGSTDRGSASLEEVTAMCQLLGAVAVKQGVDLDKVFETSTTGTQCQQVAQQVAHP